MRFSDADGKWGVGSSQPEVGYVELSIGGDAVVGELYGSPKLGGVQRYLSPSPTNVCQKNRREKPGKWRAEGVDWQETHEDLQYDFIRQRPDWGKLLLRFVCVYPHRKGVLTDLKIWH
jgi:hypothetical protein